MLDPGREKKAYLSSVIFFIVLIQDYPQETHLYPEASEAGNLDIRVAGQVGPSDIVGTL